MTPEWEITAGLTPYETALEKMEARVAALIDNNAETRELVWLLEHPPLYTAGTSAKAADLLQARFPVYETGRGGQYTYHGPGQRIAYVMLDLSAREKDLRHYVWQLEEWVIRALARLNVTATRRSGRVGLWVARKDTNGNETGLDDKIAAIGVRVRKWVSFHGVSINVSPDISHYNGIIPCGIAEHGITSLAALGNAASMDDLDAALKAEWKAVFA